MLKFFGLERVTSKLVEKKLNEEIQTTKTDFNHSQEEKHERNGKMQKK